MKNISLFFIKGLHSKLFTKPSIRIFISKYFRKLFVILYYFDRTGNIINLKSPTNLNELILYNNLKYNPLIVKCSDKYKVREYITSIGYKNILNELYGVYDNTDNINFNELPNQFVIKANHGCGYNIICKDKTKLRWDEAKKILNKWLHETYGLYYGEWHYSKIKPLLIVEKYLPSLDNDYSLIDYKIHCIKGEPKWILVTFDRTKTSVKLATYNLKWEKCDYLKYEATDEIKCPTTLSKMIEISKVISKDFEFVRVDFYEIEGKLIFGELTFTPAASIMSYYKDEVLNNCI